MDVFFYSSPFEWNGLVKGLHSYFEINRQITSISLPLTMPLCWKQSFQPNVWRISAHKFTTLVPNLVWVLGFSLGTTLVA
jgi:hypothetical protein